MTLKRFISELDVAQIPFVSWKSNDAIEDAVLGANGRDIDVFIPASHRDRFRELARGHGLVRLYNKFPREIKGTEGFLLFDESIGRQIYIHAHYRLITGPRLVKGYSIDEEEILEAIVKNSYCYDIKMINPVKEFELQLLRMSIKKNATIYHRVVNNRRAFYSGEWDEQIQYLLKEIPRSEVLEKLDMLLGSGFSQEVFSSLLDSELSNAVLDRIYSRNINNRIKKRWSVFYEIFYFLKMSALVIHTLVSKFLYSLPKKKVETTSQLPIFVLTGPDLAGKSTLGGQLETLLGWKLPISFRYGGGLGGQRNSIAKYFSIRYIAKKLSGHKRRAGMSPIPKEASKTRIIAKCLWSVLLAVVKRADFAYAKFKGKRGIVVLYDRFPLYFDGEWIDGPMLSGATESRFEAWFSSIEISLYQTFKTAEISVLMLVPPLEVVKTRVTVEDLHYIELQHLRYAKVSESLDDSFLVMRDPESSLVAAQRFIFERLGH